MKRVFTTFSQKWPEYLLEVIVITAGILGAFMLNSWNENRLDLKKEQLLLRQLQNEYQQNLNQLEEKIELRNFTIGRCFEILKMMDDPSSIDPDTLFSAMNYLGIMPTFDPISSDVIVAGNIRLIRNTRLKELLQQWSSDLVQVQEEEQKWVRISIDQWIPLMNKLGFTRAMASSTFHDNQGAEDVLKLILIDSTKYAPRLPLPKPSTTPDVQVLLDSKEFDGILTSCLLFNQIANEQSYILRDKIIEMLDLIDMGINK